MDDPASLSEHDSIFCAYTVQSAREAVWCRSILFVYPESNQTVLVAAVHSSACKMVSACRRVVHRGTWALRAACDVVGLQLTELGAELSLERRCLRQAPCQTITSASSLVIKLQVSPSLFSLAMESQSLVTLNCETSQYSFDIPRAHLGSRAKLLLSSTPFPYM